MARGRPKGKNNKKQICVTLKPEVHKMLNEVANDKLLSISETIEFLVAVGYKQIKEDNKNG